MYNKNTAKKCGGNSVVECFLAKEDVASSSLVSRSIKKLHHRWGFFMDRYNGKHSPIAQFRTSELGLSAFAVVLKLAKREMPLNARIQPRLDYFFNKIYKQDFLVKIF